MRMFARFAALVTCTVLLAAPLIGSAQPTEVSERIRQVGTERGFEESDAARLTQGEIVGRNLKKDSKKELALAVAMVVKAPCAEVSDWIQRAEIDDVDQTMLSHGAIPDGAVSADSFASLKRDSGELDRLLLLEPAPRGLPPLMCCELESNQHLSFFRAPP